MVFPNQTSFIERARGKGRANQERHRSNRERPAKANLTYKQQPSHTFAPLLRNQPQPQQRTKPAPLLSPKQSKQAKTATRQPPLSPQSKGASQGKLHQAPTANTRKSRKETRRQGVEKAREGN